MMTAAAATGPKRKGTPRPWKPYRIVLDVEMHDQFRELAFRNRTTISAEVREAIKRGLAKTKPRVRMG